MATKKTKTVQKLPERTPYFKVTYSDGRELLVKESPWLHLEDITILQEEIVKDFLLKSGAVGELFKLSNKGFLDKVKKLAALLNVVGEEGGLNIEEIASLDELTRIFITTTEHRHEKYGWVITKGDEPLEPSEIARLHKLNFFAILEKCFNQLQSQKKKERAEISELSPVPEA